MSYNEVPTVATGDLWSAANNNTYIRDNFADHETRMLAAESSISSLLAHGLFLIVERVLDEPAASFIFSSIPATYSHLKLIINVRGDYASNPDTYLYLRLNNDATSGNYAYQTQGRIYTSSVGSCIYVSQTQIWVADIPCDSALAGSFAPIEMLLPNYSSNSNRKSVLSNFGYMTAESTSGLKVGQHAGFWKLTDVINRIDLFPYSGNFVVGSKFSLYGLK